MGAECWNSVRGSTPALRPAALPTSHEAGVQAHCPVPPWGGDGFPSDWPGSSRIPEEARSLHNDGSQLPLPRNQSQGSRKHGKEKPASKVRMGELEAGREKGGRSPPARDCPSHLAPQQASRVTQRSRATGSEGTSPCPDLLLRPPRRWPHALPWPHSPLAVPSLPHGGGTGFASTLRPPKLTT